jgi:arylsulfatase A-like enzyme
MRRTPREERCRDAGSLERGFGYLQTMSSVLGAAWLRLLYLLLFCLPLAWGCSREEAADSPGPARNLILISLDTVRPDHLGAYGYPKPTSPTIDRLAQSGAMFRDAVAVSPWTLPSHATLLTGVYPRRHGARYYDSSLALDLPSLPELLAAAGFRSAAIVNSLLLEKSSGLARGFDDFQYVSEWREFPDGRKQPVDTGGQVTEAAIRWLSERGEAPFFLFLHYYDAHSNYAARGEYRQLFASDYRGEINGSTRQLMQVVKGSRQLDAADLEQLEGLYDAGLRQLDDEVARLLKHLAQETLTRDTAVLITSDHGEEFMEHDSVLHARTYYREVIGVPLIIAGPGVPQGWQSDFVASHIDMAPTLLGLAGQPVPSSMEGLDLTKLWRSGPAADSNPSIGAERYLFAEADHHNEEPDQYRMVRSAQFKLILDRRSGASVLYDLAADPAEQRDVRRERPQLADAHLAALRSFEAARKGSGPSVELSSEERDALRELGYAD